MKRGLLAAIVVLGMTAGGYYAYAAVTASKVTVTEKEFKMNPSPSLGKSGLVTFTVKNNGHLKHQFIVLKTNVAQGKLPVKASKAVLVGKVEGKISAVGPGQTKRLTVKLPAGKYILLCNLPAHYQAGQHAAFRVG